MTTEETDVLQARVGPLRADHPLLVQVIEELGREASGEYSNLCIKEIETSLYRIDEYDGSESVITPEGISWINIE
jgi:hypothetical protein